MHDLPAERRQSFLDGVAREGTTGGRVYDTPIGVIARVVGTRLLRTDNRSRFTAVTLERASRRDSR